MQYILLSDIDFIDIIMCEHLFDCIWIITLTKHPHQFCNTCLTSHIISFNHAMFQYTFTDFINREVTSFIQALTAYNNTDTLIQQINNLS